MDTRRLLIAALLSLAVMVAWGYFFPPPETTRPEAAPPQPTTQEPTAPPQQEPAATTPTRPEPEEVGTAPETAEPGPLAATGEERVVVTGDGYRAEFSNRGAQLVSFQLLEHASASGGPVDLVRSRAAPPYLFGLVDAGGGSSRWNDVLFVVDREAAARGEEVVAFRYRGPEGEAEKRFVFLPNGLIEMEVEVAGQESWAVAVGPGLRNPSSEEMASRFARRSAVYRHAEGVERVDPGGARGPQSVMAAGVRWIGLQDTYFLTAVIPAEGLEEVLIQPAAVIPPTGEGAERFVTFRDVEELSEAERELGRECYLFLEPEGKRLSAAIYLGAKQYDRLAALPHGLEETVQLGWFKFLSLPLLWGLRWIHDHAIANYGWAIILMTILIRLLLFPLTHKSTMSMQKMQEVNPKVQAIRQKYRGKLKDKRGRPDPEMQRKMNEETMALYKAEGVNPAGGCLPMLLQIPVLFAFYNILSAAIEIRQAPWIFWIQDLSAKDPFYVLPIVMGATQFLQQKMTPQAGDPMQRRMFALMPIFFTVLFLGFPSGLVLYWLTNNVLGIGQQALYKRLRESKEEAAKGSGESPRPDRSKRGSRK